MKARLVVLVALSAATVAADDIFRSGEFFIGCDSWGLRRNCRHAWKSMLDP